MKIKLTRKESVDAVRSIMDNPALVGTMPTWRNPSTRDGVQMTWHKRADGKKAWVFVDVTDGNTKSTDRFELTATELGYALDYAQCEAERLGAQLTCRIGF